MALFSDLHASRVTLPVAADGKGRGTVNPLAETGHFTPDRRAACQALVTRAEPAIRAAPAGIAPAQKEPS